MWHADVHLGPSNWLWTMRLRNLSCTTTLLPRRKVKQSRNVVSPKSQFIGTHARCRVLACPWDGFTFSTIKFSAIHFVLARGPLPGSKRVLCSSLSHWFHWGFFLGNVAAKVGLAVKVTLGDWFGWTVTSPHFLNAPQPGKKPVKKYQTTVY